MAEWGVMIVNGGTATNGVTSVRDFWVAPVCRQKKNITTDDTSMPLMDHNTSNTINKSSTDS